MVWLGLEGRLPSTRHHAVPALHGSVAGVPARLPLRSWQGAPVLAFPAGLRGPAPENLSLLGYLYRGCFRQAAVLESVSETRRYGRRRTCRAVLCGANQSERRTAAASFGVVPALLYRAVPAPRRPLPPPPVLPAGVVGLVISMRNAGCLKVILIVTVSSIWIAWVRKSKRIHNLAVTEIRKMEMMWLIKPLSSYNLKWSLYRKINN